MPASRMPAMPVPALTVLAVLLMTAAAAAEHDFARIYPATLDASEKPVGHEWVTQPDDVWRLSRFALDWGDDLRIHLADATVVFGRKDRNVLWAVLTPDAPQPLASRKAGDTEKIAAIWLRFHPTRVAELFPPATVSGPGPHTALVPARRIAAWKMIASWQAGNLPVVPTRGSLIVDVDTTAGTRRFFSRDVSDPSREPEVTYVAAFENRALPPLVPVDADQALATFDAVWSAFDREYAMFDLREGIDWPRLRNELRPDAQAAKNTYDVGLVLARLLAPLRDLHVSVRVGDEFIPVYNRPRPLNASWNACRTLVGTLQTPRGDLAWTKTDDGIGYVNIFRLNDRDLPRSFDDVLDKLAAAWAIILDLRFNGGGGEDLAQKVAGRFVDAPAVYSRNQYRSGPNHHDLGPMLERTIEPRGPWTWRAPLVVLIGQKTMSSAESFALMLAQSPAAVLIGDRTAGASANPRLLELPGAIRVSLPRWIDYRPDGVPLEVAGVPPTVRIDAAEDAFTDDRDPVLEAALARLRQTPADQRRPAKRD